MRAPTDAQNNSAADRCAGPGPAAADGGLVGAGRRGVGDAAGVRTEVLRDHH